MFSNKKIKDIQNRVIHIEEKLKKNEITEHLTRIEEKLDPVLIRNFFPQHYFGHPYQFFGPYTYAQHGEDLIFKNIFQLLGIEKPSYIDIGAHHPVDISNTALLYKTGSRGINIEANPCLIEAFHRERPEDINLNIGISNHEDILDFYMIDANSPVNTFDKKIAEQTIMERPWLKISEVKKIKVLTLQQIISEYSNGIYPDLLTIDIEGYDYRVLKSANFKTSFPKVICVEVNNKEFPAMQELMYSYNYLPYMKTFSNTIFLHESCYKIIMGPVTN